MSQHPLRLLLDFEEQIQRDRDHNPAFLHRRDRRFALECEANHTKADVIAWLAHIKNVSGPAKTTAASESILRQWRQIHSGFAIAGALLGVFTMSGLLFFDGGSRINITGMLGFVLLQLLLALATSIQSLVGWQPWRWLLMRWQKTPASPTRRQLQPLLMARAAHTGGSLFGLCGLATLLVLLVVQDLAFGWSTTLDTAADSYHKLIQWFAIPWQTLWPAAVPSLELVEATRFFRADPSAITTTPAQWGQWWPFVVMLWLGWVVLPRLLLLALAQTALRGKASKLLASHPALHALQYRLETPTLDTGNQHHDAHDLPDTRTGTTPEPLPEAHFLVCWAGAGKPQPPEALTGQDIPSFQAGGQASLGEDDDVIATIARLSQPHQVSLRQQSATVLVITQSWQPPTGELQDFLEQAHAAWPEGTRIALLPLAPVPDHAPEPHLLQPWLRFANRLPAHFARVVALPDQQHRNPEARS